MSPGYTLVPAIHDLLAARKTWMPGPRPGMSSRDACVLVLDPPPHRVGDRDDALELAPLVLFRDHQMIEAAEAALRAECKLLDRQIPARLVDAPSQQIERLEIR